MPKEDSMHLRLLGAALLVGFLPAPSRSQAPVTVTPDQAIQRLKDGNARFVAGNGSTKHIGADRRAALVRGQHPFAVVLGCADSRVVPEYIFDQGLGDVFVLRVAGNIADGF